MYKKTITLFIILTSVCIFNYCKMSTEPISNAKFQIQVDSLFVPNTISLNDTLVCKFWAIIGPDLCHQFSHFETKLNSKQIDFKLWGYNTGAEICATAVSELSGKEYKFIPESKGIFLINVFQPDNSILKDSVLVK